MTLIQDLYDAVRIKYDIPADASLDIMEEISASGSCCHDYGVDKEVWIVWSYVPEGKKRAVKKSVCFSGTTYDLLLELS